MPSVCALTATRRLTNAYALRKVLQQRTVLPGSPTSRCATSISILFTTDLKARRAIRPHWLVRAPLCPRRTARNRSDDTAPTSHPADERYRRHDQAHPRTRPPDQGTRGGCSHLTRGLKG